jgi:hypothetical protein
LLSDEGEELEAGVPGVAERKEDVERSVDILPDAKAQ